MQFMVYLKRKEMLKQASPMHDIEKLQFDAVLNKLKVVLMKMRENYGYMQSFRL